MRTSQTYEMDLAVNALWTRLGKEHHYPIRSRLTFSTKCALLRLYGQFTDHLSGLYPTEPVPPLLEIVERIARERWNWQKSPAPMNLLGAEASWTLMAQTYLRAHARRLAERENRLARLREWATGLLKTGHSPHEVVRLALLQKRNHDFDPDDFDYWKKQITQAPTHPCPPSRIPAENSLKERKCVRN